jgi:hypothetical protein
MNGLQDLLVHPSILLISQEKRKIEEVSPSHLC